MKGKQMTVHRESPPAGKKYTAIIVRGATSKFLDRKEKDGVTDLYLWHERGFLCAAWEEG